MKRLFDITAAFAALLLLALPLALLTWQVRRKLGSPAFFRQVRPGMHGKPFKMVKFRSMTSERGPDGELLPDAVRLTPFGRFFRRCPTTPWRTRRRYVRRRRRPRFGPPPERLRP